MPEDQIERIKKRHSRGHYEGLAQDVAQTLLARIAALEQELGKKKARKKKIVVQEVMVRMDAEEFGVLQHVALPGEAMAHTFLRTMTEAVLPRDILLRFRVKPDDRRSRLFPDWVQQGPMSVEQAAYRGQMLLMKGYYEVETRQVPGISPSPAWPEEAPDPTCASEDCGEVVLNEGESCDDCGG